MLATSICDIETHAFSTPDTAQCTRPAKTFAVISRNSFSSPIASPFKVLTRQAPPFKTQFRRIIGWHVGWTTLANFVLDALEPARCGRRPDHGYDLVSHSQITSDTRQAGSRCDWPSWALRPRSAVSERPRHCARQNDQRAFKKAGGIHRREPCHRLKMAGVLAAIRVRPPKPRFGLERLCSLPFGSDLPQAPANEWASSQTFQTPRRHSNSERSCSFRCSRGGGSVPTFPVGRNPACS